MSNNAALLIIDVQVMLVDRDKFDGHKLFERERLLNNINKLIKKAREAGKPIVYIQHTDNIYLKEGDPSWEIYPQVKPQKDDIIIQKQFQDSFQKTSLHEKLQSLNISKLIIAGLCTEYCVDTTCRRAFSLGYKNVLVSDAHSTFDSDTLSASQIIDHHNRVIETPDFPELRFADVIKTEEVEL